MDDLFSLKKPGTITDIRAGVRWTSEDLRQQVSGRFAALTDRNLRPGDTVLICHGGTLEFFADLFAVWLHGACAVCLNPKLTYRELLNVANFVSPTLALSDQNHEVRSQDFPLPVLCLAECGDKQQALPDRSPAADKDPAVILFTSGTTGDPKGVVHSFQSLSERLAHNRRHLPASTLARTLCLLPTHFGHGLIGNCMTPLSAGADLLLFQNPGIDGASKLGGVIDDNRVTFMSSVASFWKIVLKTGTGPQQSTLKQVSVGSAPLSEQLWQSIIDWSGCANVVNMYGITETANWIAGASAVDFDPEGGLVGNLWGGSAAVLTAENSVANSGTGELLLDVPSIMSGYFQRQDLTDAVMHENWYRTGDWGEIDAHGVIRLKGRIKTEINKAGIKILPEELDLLFESHDGIIEACTFALPDPVSGETVAIAVSLADGVTLTAGDLREWCQDRLREDAVPERWFFLAEIPKTDRGKINRQQVKEHCLAND